MAGLGYEQYFVHGGDWGSAVAQEIARNHPDRVLGLHLTDVPFGNMFLVDEAEVSAAEALARAAGRPDRSPRAPARRTRLMHRLRLPIPPALPDVRTPGDWMSQGDEAPGRGEPAGAAPSSAPVPLPQLFFFFFFFF